MTNQPNWMEAAAEAVRQFVDRCHSDYFDDKNKFDCVRYLAAIIAKHSEPQREANQQCGQDCQICRRREALEQRGIALVVGFQGKSGCIPNYTVRRELRNDDGYYEGDGGEEWLCWDFGFVNLAANEKRSEVRMCFFDTIDAALAAAERGNR